MSSIVYPRQMTKGIYDIIGSNFTSKQFVKINTLKDKPCVYDSFLMATYKNYQETEDKDKLQKIRQDFIKEFRGYLEAESEMSNQFIYNKVFEAYNMVDMKDLYMLKSVKDDFDIFDLVIVRRDFSDNDTSLRGYKLFPDRVKKYFSNVSNFFSLISIDFLKDIIEQRIIRKSYMDKIKRLRLQDEDSDQIEELQEIIHFMDRKENNLDIISLRDSISLEDCEDQDLVLKLLSEMLDINILLCRAWSTELSVLKDYNKDEGNPYVIIFKGGGRSSITGTISEKFYEAGGIKTDDGIKTMLMLKDKDAINDLKKILENDVDSYFLEKYNKYLRNIEQKPDLDNLGKYYEDSDDEEDPEMEDQENIGEEDTKSLKTTEIPGFIMGYTRTELEQLLNMFVNPEYDYSETDILDMQIQYKNYLENINEDI